MSSCALCLCEHELLPFMCEVNDAAHGAQLSFRAGVCFQHSAVLFLTLCLQVTVLIARSVCRV